MLTASSMPGWGAPVEGSLEVCLRPRETVHTGVAALRARAEPVRAAEAQQAAYEASRVVLAAAARRRDATWRHAARASRRRAAAALVSPAASRSCSWFSASSRPISSSPGSRSACVIAVVSSVVWVRSAGVLTRLIGGTAVTAERRPSSLEAVEAARLVDVAEGLFAVFGVPGAEIRVLDDPAPNADVGRQPAASGCRPRDERARLASRPDRARGRARTRVGPHQAGRHRFGCDRRAGLRPAGPARPPVRQDRRQGRGQRTGASRGHGGGGRHPLPPWADLGPREDQHGAEPPSHVPAVAGHRVDGAVFGWPPSTSPQTSPSGSARSTSPSGSGCYASFERRPEARERVLGLAMKSQQWSNLQVDIEGG